VDFSENFLKIIAGLDKINIFERTKQNVANRNNILS
jgi:hypothetical protein